MSHWLRPSGSAVRPSSVAAILLRTSGQPRRMRRHEAGVEALRLGGQETAADLDARRPERLLAAAVHPGIGIRRAVDDPPDSGGDQATVHGGVRPVWQQGSRVT